MTPEGPLFALPAIPPPRTRHPLEVPMVRTLYATFAAVVALAAAAAGSPANAQTVGKCTPSTVAQNWPNATIVQFVTGKTTIKPDYQKQLATTAQLAKD